jgi:hypothetical protein
LRAVRAAIVQSHRSGGRKSSSEIIPGEITPIHFVQKMNKVVLKKCDHAAMNDFGHDAEPLGIFHSQFLGQEKMPAAAAGGYRHKLQGLQFIGLKTCQNTGIHLEWKSHKVVPTI